MRQIPEKIDSKFRFVLLAATRAEQIMRGAQPKVTKSGAKHTRLAIEEVFEEAVGWEYGPEVVEVGLAAGRERGAVAAVAAAAN